MDDANLIHDWNSLGDIDWSAVEVDLNDETLRDGLQSPSAIDPAPDDKRQLLHMMADLGIVAADIGLPGAGPRAAVCGSGGAHGVQLDDPGFGEGYARSQIGLKRQFFEIIPGKNVLLSRIGEVK